jgi:hypothetical protein
MAEIESIFKETIKHKSFFNYTELYTFCYNWFKNEDYLLSEEEYLEKFTGVKEVQIKWKARKKISDYYRYIFDVKWHILVMTDEVVEENGKKIKTNKGDLKIVFEASLEKDWENSWDKHPFWKFMRGVYDRYIIRTTTDKYETELIDKAQTLVEEVKAFLNQEGKR